MKRLILLAVVLLPVAAFSQSRPVRIVFDVTSPDSSTHQAVLRHVKGMAETYPDAQLEVVVYGGAWPMVVAGKSSSGARVSALAEAQNVSFKVCGLTMERYNIRKEELVEGVDVVPDAIMEIVTRQGEGWGYIKESHN